MFNIIRQIVGFTQSGTYLSTDEQYYLSVCCGMILILTIVTCEWLRQIFKSLINRIR